MKYDAIILGAGIGGLMIGAKLSKNMKVLILERLSFAGGRYTEIDYKGYAVTTGSWTSIGEYGNIGRFCREVGAKIEYITLRDLKRIGKPHNFIKIWFPDGSSYSFNPFIPRYAVKIAEFFPKFFLLPFIKRKLKNFFQIFPEEEAKKIAGLLPSIFLSEQSDEKSTKEFISSHSEDEELLKIMNSFVGTASGLTIDTLPAGEFSRIIKDVARVGMDFGFPRGGVRSIVNALMDVILSNQGKIQLSSEVEKILIEDGKAVGVLSGGKMIESGMVIHNAGARALLKLAGESNFPREYVERIKNLIPVECGAIIVGSREYLIRDAAILLPVGCRRIVGIFEPTFFDSTVAPPGCSMIDAFFPLKGSEVKNELELAMDDLRMIFPRFEKNADFILPMLFHKDWPGAETAQTFGQVGEQRLSPRTPVEKLYIVGMDAVGSGVAGDLIPVGVRRALQFISKDVKSQI